MSSFYTEGPVMQKLASALRCLGLEAPSSLLAERPARGASPDLSHMSPGSAWGSCNQCFILFHNLRVACPSSADACLRQNSGLDLCPLAPCALPSPPLPPCLTVTPPALAYLSFHPSLGAGGGGVPCTWISSALAEAAAALNSLPQKYMRE